jgi:hypothetical protein
MFRYGGGESGMFTGRFGTREGAASARGAAAHKPRRQGYDKRWVHGGVTPRATPVPKARSSGIRLFVPDLLPQIGAEPALCGAGSSTTGAASPTRDYASPSRLRCF